MADRATEQAFFNDEQHPERQQFLLQILTARETESQAKLHMETLLGAPTLNPRDLGMLQAVHAQLDNLEKDKSIGAQMPDPANPSIPPQDTQHVKEFSTRLRTDYSNRTLSGDQKFFLDSTPGSQKHLDGLISIAEQNLGIRPGMPEGMQRELRRLVEYQVVNILDEPEVLVRRRREVENAPPARQNNAPTIQAAAPPPALPKDTPAVQAAPRVAGLSPEALSAARAAGANALGDNLYRISPSEQTQHMLDTYVAGKIGANAADFHYQKNADTPAERAMARIVGNLRDRAARVLPPGETMSSEQTIVMIKGDKPTVEVKTFEKDGHMTMGVILSEGAAKELNTVGLFRAAVAETMARDLLERDPKLQDNPWLTPVTPEKEASANLDLKAAKLGIWLSGGGSSDMVMSRGLLYDNAAPAGAHPGLPALTNEIYKSQDDLRKAGNLSAPRAALQVSDPFTLAASHAAAFDASKPDMQRG